MQKTSGEVYFECVGCVNLTGGVAPKHVNAVYMERIEHADSARLAVARVADSLTGRSAQPYQDVAQQARYLFLLVGGDGGKVG